MATGLRSRALALERRLQRMLQRSFELRWGVDTAHKIDLEDLGVAGAERAFYLASPAFATRHTLRRIRPSRQDVLVDLGSGKGQAVLVAAQLGFGRVIGVELSETLNTIARANLAKAKPRLPSPEIDLLTSDALEWAIPRDLSVVYMYSPFVGDLFAAMIRRIVSSFDEHPRPLLIVYGYPFEHNRLIATRRVRTVDVNPAFWPRRPGWWDSDHVFVTYQVTAPDGSSPSRSVATGGYGWRKAIDYWSRPNQTQFLLTPEGSGPVLRSGKT